MGIFLYQDGSTKGGYMVFGKTKEQKYLLEQARLKSMIHGKRRFRLFARLEDGRLAICQYVWEFADGLQQVGEHGSVVYKVYADRENVWKPSIRRYLDYSDLYIRK